VTLWPCGQNAVTVGTYCFVKDKKDDECFTQQNTLIQIGLVVLIIKEAKIFIPQKVYSYSSSQQDVGHGNRNPLRSV